MSEYSQLLEDLQKKDHEAMMIQQRIQDKIQSLAESLEGEDLSGLSIKKLTALLQVKESEFEDLREKSEAIEARAKEALSKLKDEIDEARSLL